MDKLQEILNKQEALQVRLNSLPDRKDEHATTKFIRDNVIYTLDELSEMMREIPFNKHWKDYTDFDRPTRLKNARVEYIDALHFFMNIGLALGLDAEMIYSLYMDKNAENHKRQDEGYGFHDNEEAAVNE